MYGCGVLIGIIVAGGSACSCSYESAVFGFLTAVFLQAGTFALNDFYDLESDIANQRRDRPLVRGELKKEEALLVACVAVVVGLFFASFLGWVLFLLASVLAVLGVLYDVKLKEVLAVSNIYIAFTMAVPFVFGGLIAEPTAVGTAVRAAVRAAVGAAVGTGAGAGVG
ncbi:prenyltransferase, partial [ANME-1 cluster archaeon ex4572_4]